MIPRRDGRQEGDWMSDLSVFSDLCLAWAGQKKRLNSVKHADTNGTRLIEAGNAPPAPSEKTRAVFSFLPCQSFQCKWFGCFRKELFPLWQHWGNYFSTEAISYSHHRLPSSQREQTWQKIRLRVMCLPVVLEVSSLWSTKMESFWILSPLWLSLLSARAGLCLW